VRLAYGIFASISQAALRPGPDIPPVQPLPLARRSGSGQCHLRRRVCL